MTEIARTLTKSAIERKQPHYGASAPASPIAGKEWYDTSTSPPTLRVWNGAAWEQPASGGEAAGSILTKLKTVDGSGSGLDADLLDGMNSSAFLTAGGKAADSDLLDGLDATAFALADGTRLRAYRSTTAPSSPSAGQLWLDTNFSPAVLKEYDGAAWQAVSLFRVRDEGTLLTYATEIDFLGAGVTAAYNATSGRLEVTITGASVGSATEGVEGTTRQATAAQIQNGDAGNLFATAARLKAEFDRRLAVAYAFDAERITSLQDLPGATWTTVIFNQENYDVGGNYDPTSGIFTAPVAGFWQFNGSIGFTNAASGDFVFVGLSKNNASPPVPQVGSVRATAGSPNPLGVPFCVVLELAAGDTVRVMAWSNVVGGMDVGANSMSRLQGQYLGARP